MDNSGQLDAAAAGAEELLDDVLDDELPADVVDELLDDESVELDDELDDSELPPEPSMEAPRSLTTTLAPRRASSSAWQRPRPPPAPVTIAT